MSPSTIVSIIEKYSTAALSEEETSILNEWLDGVSPEEFHRMLDACTALPEGLRAYPSLPPEFARRLELAIDEADSQEETIPLFHWKKWTAAAAAVVLLSTGAWWWMTHDHNRTPRVKIAANDVSPGINGAILTLADGKQIVLDSTSNSFSATDGHAKISKGSKDQLTYKAADAGAGSTGAAAGTPAELVYNTLSTPRGRKISVVLADGTKVWLNAASSIKFPTIFSGSKRLVEIRGEAYFEVAANVKQPFVVKKMGSDYEVQVLGTQFNINAYDDEDLIKTTLLDGAVRIKNKILKPGQQAVGGKDQEEVTVVPNVNTGEVLAWKNGVFNFDHADIYTVMRQVARWYDVDVEYKGTFTRHFGGTISQNVNVSQVFKMLELTGAVRFTVEGRKVTVMP
ncbi:MAG TPA: FecR domain-containing protein [Puia sp.]|jgi:ferric-dicitrate binding protein FerR (iron transport regulator)